MLLHFRFSKIEHQPLQLRKNLLENETVIQNIKLLNEDTLLPVNSKLPSKLNTISFYYRGICLTNPDKVKYRKKLEGLDREWSAPTSEDYIKYSNLAPGKYIFKVLSCNNEGVWNKKETSFAFEILSPFYFTGWFITSCILCLILCIYTFFILRLRYLKQKQKEEFDKLKEQSEAFENLKTQFDSYERNKLRKARYELEVEQKQLEINTKQGKLSNYENNKKKLEENQRIDGEVVRLKTQIETANANIKNYGTIIERHRNNISNMTQKIENNKKVIAKIKEEDELSAVFKIYLTIYGKNGISKVIMKTLSGMTNHVMTVNKTIYYMK